MRAFACPTCARLVYFENSECLHCHTALGFDPATLTLVAADPPAWRRCANATRAECNWLVPGADPATDVTTDAATDVEVLCRCCELTRTRPADDDAEGLAAFAATEAAKRRLVFQLLDLGLDVPPYDPDAGTGLAFDLLSSQVQDVMIGHAGGLVTLDVDEADDARREQVRQQMGEAYRTMLGHLRHEIGHFYWPLLVGGDATELGRFRKLFGDERASYAEALDAHYAGGPPPDWPDRYVSAYATMHPWEDWAESFAHHLHIRDALQTAAAFGMVVTGPDGVAVHEPADLVSVPEVDAGEASFGELLGDWLPLTYALNAVNRSLGRPDLYPFVLSPVAIQKLAFVHRLVRDAAAGSATTMSGEPGDAA